MRLRDASDADLTGYERRVLDHLRKRASDGVVPAGALAIGPEWTSSRWVFTSEVIVDAKARGLSRDAVAGGVFTALTVAAGVPAVLTWAVTAFQGGVAVVIVAVALLGWMRARQPQRETPAGLEAASRWLGVRAELAENEVFETHSPLTVELWDRLLAYGAALGVARGAIGPLHMGAGSDHVAWSPHSGSWRAVRVTYPRLWPIGWGFDPLVALAGGGAVLGGALALYFVGPSLFDAVGGSGALGVIPGAMLLVPCLAVMLGAALVVMAWSDYRGTVELTGPILRLRSFGDDDDRRYYVAIDDGSSGAIRAWRVRPSLYTGLQQGEVVTAAFTRNLGCVRWIIRRQEDEETVGAYE